MTEICLVSKPLVYWLVSVLYILCYLAAVPYSVLVCLHYFLFFGKAFPKQGYNLVFGEEITTNIVLVRLGSHL